MDKKDSLTSSTVHSPYLNTSISWGLPTESSISSSAVTESLSLKVDASSQRLLNSKKMCFHDQDSSSTQSTGQSSTKVSCSRDNNPSRQISFSIQSDVCRGIEETQRKGFANNVRAGSSMTGTSDIHFVPANANFSFHYPDPHLGGLVPAAYVPNATIWKQQMVGRVQLPLDLIENESVYVNAKQFHAIMRRRKQRAKLEAQNKLIKARKPYLHESRHVHALKRPRGSGGRFLNTKNIQESTEPKRTKENMSGFKALQLQNIKNHGCSTTSGSDITSVSDSVNIFRQSEFQLSDFTSQTNPAMYVHGQSNDMHGGENTHTHHLSVHI